MVVTGERNLVFSRDEHGRLQPREVVLGASAGDRIAILAGLSEGERIVASANFLVDAESRLGGSSQVFLGTRISCGTSGHSVTIAIPKNGSGSVRASESWPVWIAFRIARV